MSFGDTSSSIKLSSVKFLLSASESVCWSSALYLGITSGVGFDIIGINPAYSASHVLSCQLPNGPIGTTSGEMLFSASQIIYLHVKALSVNTLSVNCMWEQRKASADYGVGQLSRGKQS